MPSPGRRSQQTGTWGYVVAVKILEQAQGSQARFRDVWRCVSDVVRRTARAAPAAALGMLLCQLAGALVPVASLWTTRVLVDSLVSGRVGVAVAAVGIQGALGVAGTGFSAVGGYLGTVVNGARPRLPEGLGGRGPGQAVCGAGTARVPRHGHAAAGVSRPVWKLRGEEGPGPWSARARPVSSAGGGTARPPAGHRGCERQHSRALGRCTRPHVDLVGRRGRYGGDGYLLAGPSGSAGWAEIPSRGTDLGARGVRRAGSAHMPQQGCPQAG